eukprot:82561-Chlamydomonas_euryale.AAC.1
MQLGGPRVMGHNGVSHHVVRDDLEVRRLGVMAGGAEVRMLPDSQYDVRVCMCGDVWGCGRARIPAPQHLHAFSPLEVRPPPPCRQRLRKEGTKIMPCWTPQSLLPFLVCLPPVRTFG